MSLLKESDELKVTFKDLDELRDLIERVNHWKFCVNRFLKESNIEHQYKNREKFKNYLNEAKLLKLGDLPLVKTLQK